MRIAIGVAIIIAGGMVASPAVNVMCGESDAVMAYPALQMAVGIIISSIGAGVACAHDVKALPRRIQLENRPPISDPRRPTCPNQPVILPPAPASGYHAGCAPTGP